MPIHCPYIALRALVYHNKLAFITQHNCSPFLDEMTSQCFGMVQNVASFICTFVTSVQIRSRPFLQLFWWLFERKFCIGGFLKFDFWRFSLICQNLLIGICFSHFHAQFDKLHHFCLQVGYSILRSHCNGHVSIHNLICLIGLKLDFEKPLLARRGFWFHD